MESVCTNLGSRLALLGVLVTRNNRRVITDSALALIREYFGDRVFKTTVPENIRVEEAHNAHLPLWEYDSKCKAAVAYRQLAKEVAQCQKVRKKAHGEEKILSKTKEKHRQAPVRAHRKSRGRGNRGCCSFGSRCAFGCDRDGGT